MMLGDVIAAGANKRLILRKTSLGDGKRWRHGAWSYEAAVAHQATKARVWVEARLGPLRRLGMRD